MKNLSILSHPFRPFFLLTVLSAIFFPMYLVCVLVNNYSFPGELLTVGVWHGHELLFGMTIALFTGFLLTASTHWTGKKPVINLKLALLVFIWIVTRIVFFIQPSPLGLILIAPVLDLILLVLMLKILPGNPNFYILNPILFVFSIAHILYLYGALYDKELFYGLGFELAQFCLSSFIIIFSGRLTPFFTNSYFKEQLIKPIFKLDFAMVGLIFILAIFKNFTFMPEKIVATVYFIIAAAFIFRSFYFYNSKIWKQFLVYNIHLAGIWLPIYFALKGLVLFFPELSFTSTHLHALFTGAIALFALCVMTRASKGHTGRPLVPYKSDYIIFFLVFIGALMRIILPFFKNLPFSSTIHSSMGFWTLGFIIFTFIYGPMYFRPRADIPTP